MTSARDIPHPSPFLTYGKIPSFPLWSIPFEMSAEQRTTAPQGAETPGRLLLNPTVKWLKKDLHTLKPSASDLWRRHTTGLVYKLPIPA